MNNLIKTNQELEAYLYSTTDTREAAHLAIGIFIAKNNRVDYLVQLQVFLDKLATYYLIDSELIKHYANKYNGWLNSVHKSNFPLIANYSNSLFGISDYFSDEELELIEKKYDVIYNVNRILSTADDLRTLMSND